MKNEYYYETSQSRGWKYAETDEGAKRLFRGYSPIKVWRVETDGTKILIIKERRS